MWLATCGLEYPDVAVRVMEIVPGDAPDKFTLRVFRAPTQEEMVAATAPNMEVHIAGQADVKKLHKDDGIRLHGHFDRVSTDAVPADLGRSQGQ